LGIRQQAIECFWKARMYIDSLHAKAHIPVCQGDSRSVQEFSDTIVGCIFMYLMGHVKLSMSVLLE
jgi:hypothetical protein